MSFFNRFKKTPIAPAPDTIDELDKCAKLVYDNAQLNILVEKLLEKNAAKEEKSRVDNAAKEEKARSDNEEREKKARIENEEKEEKNKKYKSDIETTLELLNNSTKSDRDVQRANALRGPDIYPIRQRERGEELPPIIKKGGKKKSSKTSKKKNSNKEKKGGKNGGKNGGKVSKKKKGSKKTVGKKKSKKKG